MNLIFQKTINGKPSHFREKILKSLVGRYSMEYLRTIWHYDFSDHHPKIHSIRIDKSDRWKAGNNIHFQEWIKTPYRSKMNRFAPYIKCVSTQDIWIQPTNKSVLVWKKDHPNASDSVISGYWNELSENQITLLSKNDGFDSVEDFWNYFKNEFGGKIIHWTDYEY